MSLLEEIKSKEELADLLGVKLNKLTYLLWGQSLNNSYSIFTIKKKSGGNRNISAPNGLLKILQYRLLSILEEYYKSPSCTHGFVSKRSIVTNAKIHTDKKWVLNIDIKDFFPSINFGRVYGLFSHSIIGLPKDCAIVLAQICCFKNELPQGSPTSPIVSNMICKKLDRQLKNYTRENNCSYTRYADDITISGNQISPPSNIATLSRKKLVLSDTLVETIESNGFALNEDKTRISFKENQQEVTGLIVNKKVNVNRKFIRNLRAMLHNWNKKGLNNAEKDFRTVYNNPSSSFLETVKGKISFLEMVRGKHDIICAKIGNQYNNNIKGTREKPVLTRDIIRIELENMKEGWGGRYNNIWHNFYDKSEDPIGNKYKSAYSSTRELLRSIIDEYSGIKGTRKDRCKKIAEKFEKMELLNEAEIINELPLYYDEFSTMHTDDILKKEDCQKFLTKANKFIVVLVKNRNIIEPKSGSHVNPL